MNKIKTALISVVAVGTALLGAAPAQADTAQDARFLDEAAKHGFGSYNGSGHLLDMAQGVAWASMPYRQAGAISSSPWRCFNGTTPR